MTCAATAFAHAAESFVGTPFVLHGRSREYGVDCVGLVAGALEAVRHKPALPRAYGLRNANIEPHLRLAADNGFAPVANRQRAVPHRGDLLLVQPGAAQVHLMIALAEATFVHAHAGLRRVAIHAGRPGWPVLHHWRLGARNLES